MIIDLTAHYNQDCSKGYQYLYQYHPFNNTQIAIVPTFLYGLIIPSFLPSISHPIKTSRIFISSRKGSREEKENI